MRYILLISFFLISLFSGILPLQAVNNDANVRDTTNVTISNNPENSNLTKFVSDIAGFFYTPVDTGDTTVTNIFVSIAGGIKNFFIAIAVIFLIIGVMKLLFSSWDEEAQKKWKNNIIWVSVWVFVMQIGYSMWYSLYITDPYAKIDGRLGWTVWINIFEPIVNIMLLLASFAFIAMAVYAFYTIITGGGDEEKLKKGKNIVIYALIGFLLIRIPKLLVTALYGEPTNYCKDNVIGIWSCMIGDKNLGDGINIFGKILTYINGFIALLCVIMVMYAAWLVFMSAGDEEKLKKAKNIIIYIAVGIIALVGSQAIFRFFFLQG